MQCAHVIEYRLIVPHLTNLCALALSSYVREASHAEAMYTGSDGMYAIANLNLRLRLRLPSSGDWCLDIKDGIAYIRSHGLYTPSDNNLELLPEAVCLWSRAQDRTARVSRQHDAS